jgi:hypothetical protein
MSVEERRSQSTIYNVKNITRNKMQWQKCIPRIKYIAVDLITYYVTALLIIPWQ